MTLADFLVEAKKKTYASGKDPMPLPGGFEGFFYEKDGLRYVDEYIVDKNNKSEPFSGREFVRRLEDNAIMFEMVYEGQLLRVPEGFSKESIFAFLRECLREVPREAPFRGPRHKIKNKSENAEINLEYHNSTPNDSSQKGRERIMFTKKAGSGQTGFDVYLLHYEVKKFEQ
jgi:hypothetical protein